MAQLRRRCLFAKYLYHTFCLKESIFAPSFIISLKNSAWSNNWTKAQTFLDETSIRESKPESKAISVYRVISSGGLYTSFTGILLAKIIQFPIGQGSHFKYLPPTWRNLGFTQGHFLKQNALPVVMICRARFRHGRSPSSCPPAPRTIGCCYKEQRLGVVTSSRD